MRCLRLVIFYTGNKAICLERRTMEVTVRIARTILREGRGGEDTCGIDAARPFREHTQRRTCVCVCVRSIKRESYTYILCIWIHGDFLTSSGERASACARQTSDRERHAGSRPSPVVFYSVRPRSSHDVRVRSCVRIVFIILFISSHTTNTCVLLII